MKKIYVAALAYLIAGLAGGLFYREYTKAHDYTGDTQLAVVHTHLLALGMLLFLIVLALDATLGISGHRLFTLFFVFYNSGLVVTVAAMTVHGIRDVQGEDPLAAVSGIAGLGHILITLGLVHLFLAIRKQAAPRWRAAEAGGAREAEVGRAS